MGINFTCCTAQRGGGSTLSEETAGYKKIALIKHIPSTALCTEKLIIFLSISTRPMFFLALRFPSNFRKSVCVEPF
jgi:hypothetical protein